MKNCTVDSQRCRRHKALECMNIETPVQIRHITYSLNSFLAHTCRRLRNTKKENEMDSIPLHIGMLTHRRRGQAAASIPTCRSYCFQLHTCIQEQHPQERECYIVAIGLVEFKAVA